MAKYNDEIVKEITELIEKDSYSIAEICKIVGIAQCTYFEWQSSKPDFSEAIKKAKKARLKMFAREARKSLLKKIKGYTYEEMKIVTRSEAGEVIVQKKHVIPDTAAIIFALTNQDPDNWRNKHFNEHTGKDGKELFKSSFDVEKLSTDDLNQVEELLRKAAGE